MKEVRGFLDNCIRLRVRTTQNSKRLSNNVGILDQTKVLILVYDRARDLSWARVKVIVWDRAWENINA